MKRAFLFVVMAVLLIGAGFFAFSIWDSLDGVDIGGHGLTAMLLGIGFSLVIGIGLMVLVFYSSRSGHDDDVG